MNIHHDDGQEDGTHPVNIKEDNGAVSFPVPYRKVSW